MSRPDAARKSDRRRSGVSKTPARTCTLASLFRRPPELCTLVHNSRVCRLIHASLSFLDDFDDWESPAVRISVVRFCHVTHVVTGSPDRDPNFRLNARSQRHEVLDLTKGARTCSICHRSLSRLTAIICLLPEDSELGDLQVRCSRRLLM